MHLLDTNHLTYLAWEQGPVATRILNRVASLPDDETSTTVVSYEEAVRGWISFLSKSKKMKDQIEAYRRLNKQLRLFCRLKLVDFEEHAAIEFVRLRRNHPRIGAMDLKIAAIALSSKSVLVTTNLKDFRQIAGLELEDWTKE